MVESPFNVPRPETSNETDEEFRRKVDHMIADFTARGFNAFNVAPPMYRLAWAMGWKMVPPLFADFWKTAAFLGAVWGIGWALLMAVLVPGAEAPREFDGGDGGLEGLVKLGRFAGVFFGLFMACYYLWARYEYKIPAWADYPDGAKREGRRAVRVVPCDEPEEAVPEVVLAEDEPRRERRERPREQTPRERQPQQQREAGRATPAGDIRRWLAGTWRGAVVLQGQGQQHQVPYTQHFDAEGRPYLELAADGPSLITHVGQQIRAGQTVFTVEQLAWDAGVCRVVLSMLRESFQQYAGAWGPGVAAGMDCSTETAYTVFEFRRDGDRLVIQMQTQAQRSSAMRVLDSGSADRSSSEASLAGILQRA